MKSLVLMAVALGLLNSCKTSTRKEPPSQSAIRASVVPRKTPTPDQVKAIRPVLAAIDQDDDAQVKKLFQNDSGDLIDTNMDIGGARTFLHYAARRCRPKSIQALLEMNGDCADGRMVDGLYREDY